MAGSSFKTFEVNGHKYTVMPMAPDVAFRFGTKVLQVLSPVLGTLGKQSDGQAVTMIAQAFSQIDPDKLTKICEEAREYLYDPKNRQLNNVAIYNEWFSENPADLFIVPAFNVWKLVEDFFPNLAAMPSLQSLTKAKD